MTSYFSGSANGLRPKLRANLRHLLTHPGHLKILRRSATSQVNERVFIVGFGKDLSLFILSINKATWPVSTFEVTALAVVAFEFFFLLSMLVMKYVFSCRLAIINFGLDVLMNFHQVFGSLVTLFVVLVVIIIFFVLIEYAQHVSEKEGQAMVVLVLVCIQCDNRILLDLLVRKLAQWLLKCIAYLPCSE